MNAYDQSSLGKLLSFTVPSFNVWLRLMPVVRIYSTFYINFSDPISYSYQLVN
jgi:hypothetical protein